MVKCETTLFGEKTAERCLRSYRNGEEFSLPSKKISMPIAYHCLRQIEEFCSELYIFKLTVLPLFSKLDIVR